MLGELVAAVLGRALQAGLAAHLGYDRHESAGRGSGGGGGSEDDAGLGPQDAAVEAGERGEEAGEVLAQAGAELVVRGGAVPDRVLLGAGQHRDGLGELAAGRQRPVRVHVGAQHAGQDERVAVAGLAPGDRVPVPVPGHRHRVHRVDRPGRGAQARDQQPACLVGDLKHPGPDICSGGR